MVKAYHWAFVNPMRKIFYNITTTSLSIAVALIIGTIELLQVLATMLHLDNPVFNFIGTLDFGMFGYVIVAIFLLTWMISFGVWKFSRMDQRCVGQDSVHVHQHTHASGTTHTHQHLH